MKKAVKAKASVKKKVAAKSKGKHPGGRPTDYREEYNEQAYKLCLLKHTDVELAEFFGVCEDTIHEWKKKYPKFSESIKAGKEIADADITVSLFKSAIGYERDEVEFKVVSCGGDMGSEVKAIPVKRYYPPNPTSIIFWLKNRQKDKWRDRQEVAHDVTDNLAERMKEARERVVSGKK